MHKIATLAIALAAIAACGSDSTAAPTVTTTTLVDGASDAVTGTTVTIERSRFMPLDLTIAVGSTVTFDNLDGYAHTVTSTDASPLAFDSDRLEGNSTFDQRFDSAGEYAYYCKIHPTMRAVITVQ
jgi:plastocyanin